MVKSTRGASPKKQQPTKNGPAFRERVSRATPWALLTAGLLVLTSAVIYLPGLLGAWPVEQVKVKGVTTLKRQQQLSARLGGLIAGKSFLTLSLDDLRDHAESLGWVEAADVTRKWPSTMVIHIKERVPVAVWNDKKLVSNQGAVFAAVNEYNTKALPQLWGPTKRLQDVMRYYHRISKVLTGPGMKIKQLKVDAGLTARMTLKNGMKVVVDRDNFAFKLRRFARLYRKVLLGDERKVKRADLRYADGVAVRFANAVKQGA